ncbi:protein phosphatase Slingshot homolog 2 isoform X2 [Pristis pectinata]|uniref:protein phosphatase Slingshot homolog 2 isoform X2 n=1 Tax=Pristis pectinata TaxID=685728 RepID=UPI00223E67FD|nr:protein phosphatase Slingshot homolog 2 isoform X2 [Pristis pectinata]
MTLDAILSEGKVEAGSWCSCYGVKMTPYFSENAVISQNEINLLISESFLTVKGAALFLPRGNGSTASRINHRRNKHAGDLQQHLQAMFTLLRPEDNIRLAVRLESAYIDLTRYMVVVSTNGRQDTEESIVLGMDFFKDSTCTMGLVLPLWSDTLIHLDGDGGFSVSTVNRIHIFKPVSVQAMWSALQSLHKACEIARTHNYYPGSLYLTWISYYESRINSNQSFINEWNAMQDLQSHRSDSPVLFTDVPTERELTERLIKTKLREIMMQKDLENVTSKEIRTELEMQMVCNLREFKEYIDNEMIVILRQMDNPTEIFEHVYLGSEWNASNLEDLQNRGIRYILNITREIDNFFPGIFEYHNIRVYDEEATDLLAYWNDTYKFISKAKKNGSKCLVHCKMGISRSASTVIAYAMKEYGWNLDEAYSYVKEKRTVTKPNVGFMRQLEEYQGILLASKQRHNKLWRSHSDSDLSDHRDRINKSTVDLNRRDSTSTTEMPTDPLAEHLYNHQFLNASDTILPGVNEEIIELNSAINAENEIPTNCNPDSLQSNISSAPMPMTVTTSGTTKNCASCTSDTHPFQHCHPDKPALTQQELSSSPEYPTLLTALVGELKGDVSLNSISSPLFETGPPLQDYIASPELVAPVSSNVDAGICSRNVDRIDFFSAREKFIELSQESGARVQSHLKAEELGGGKYCATKTAAQESLEKEQQIENGLGQMSVDNLPHAKEKCTDNDTKSNEENPVSTSFSKKSSLTRSQSLNIISVKEIVTGIESNQNTGLCQTKAENVISSHIQMPKRNTVHELSADFHWSSENGSSVNEMCANDSLVAENDDSEIKQNGCHQVNIPVKSHEDCQVAAFEESVQDELIGHKQVAKWCPGSVKRATKEFEERLKQEQEYQPSVATALPVRKNSRIDGATANEFLVTNKSGDISPEVCLWKDKERGRITEDQELLLKCNEPLNQESAPEMHSNEIENPLQSKAEQVQAEVGSLSTVEHRTIHSFETSEDLDSYTQLPKKIEIIEYTHIFKPPTLQVGISDVGEEKITIKDETRVKENEVAIFSAIEAESPVKETEAIRQSAHNQKIVAVHTTDTLRHPHLLPLLDAADLAQKHNTKTAGMTFQSDSPNDVPLECEIALFDSDSAHLPLKEYQIPVLHLEGVTVSSTDTDAEIHDKETVHLELQESNREMTCLQRTDGCITLLTHEDLESSFSRFDESIREMQKMLNFSNLDHNLQHSSSNDGINHLSRTLGVDNWQAKEIEAKIRRAGLTTPSQMKRSASIAKLGYLELSRDDLFKSLDPTKTYQALSDSGQNTSCSVERTGEIRAECAVEDDPSKKKCVSISVLQDPQPTEELETSESIVQSRPVEEPLVQHAKDSVSAQHSSVVSAKQNLSQIEPSDTDAPYPTLLTAIAPQQHHHRNHPLKQVQATSEKKQTTSPLYNTM